mgnify:CR=1 FL=1
MRVLVTNDDGIDSPGLAAFAAQPAARRAAWPVAAVVVGDEDPHVDVLHGRPDDRVASPSSQ